MQPYREATSNEQTPEERVLARELGSGEELLWTGRPKNGLSLEARDTVMIPFSLVWCGFAVFWETSVVVGNAPLLFKLWGIPFVCVGLYMVIGRFFWQAWLRSKTYYGVTNRRALIVTLGRVRQTYAVDLLSAPTSLEERADDSGTIAFGNPGPNLAFNQRGAITLPRFERIPNARAVLATIEAAKERLRLPPPRAEGTP